MDSFYPTGVQAFMSQGRSYGLPDGVGPIVFWYNKEKAGVDPGEIKYWEEPSNQSRLNSRIFDIPKSNSHGAATPI